MTDPFQEFFHIDPYEGFIVCYQDAETPRTAVLPALSISARSRLGGKFVSQLEHFRVYEIADLIAISSRPVFLKEVLSQKLSVIAEESSFLATV
jgi:hypothetical protein